VEGKGRLAKKIIQKWYLLRETDFTFEILLMTGGRKGRVDPARGILVRYWAAKSNARKAFCRAENGEAEGQGPPSALVLL
jgi:hypothetical protein